MDPVEVEQKPNEPELIDFKDPINGKVIKITKEIQELIGHNISVARKVETQKFKDENENLKKQFEAVAGDKDKLAEMLQRIEEEKLTETERNEKARQREAQKIAEREAALTNKANENFRLFESTKIDNDIMSATAGYDFNNIRQAMQVLQLDGRAQLAKDAAGNYILDENGKYKTVLRLPDENGDMIEMTPKEAIASYFSKPENAHHLKSNLIPGSGSNPNAIMDANGGLVYKRDKMSDPTVKKAYFTDLKAGKPVRLV